MLNLKQTYLIVSILLLTIPVFPSAQERIESAYFELAQALNEKGDAHGALHNYKQLLEIDPQHQDALFRAGCLLYQLGNVDQAIIFFQRRLELNSSCAQTEVGLAKCWLKKENVDKAVQHYRNALKINNKITDAHRALGALFEKQNKLQQAAQHYKTAVQLDPNLLSITNRLATLFMKLHNYEQALSCYEKLLNNDRANAQLIMKKSHTLAMLGRSQEALDEYDNMLQRTPNNPALLYNVAYIHKQLGNMNKALEYYQRSLSIEPNNRRAYLGLAHALLYLGRFNDGWQAMELWNKISGKNAQTPTNLDDVSGKTVVIGGDWMHENMIQFVRYAQNLKKMGAIVALQTPQALAPLFRLCPYIDKIIVMRKESPKNYDYYIPLMNLPNLFQTTEQPIPNTLPYLHADPELTNYWKQKVGTTHQIKVGLHIYQQSGIPTYEVMHSLLRDGVDLYILHQHNQIVDLQNLPNTTIVHFSKGFKESEKDLAHLAALIKNLDLVITGDSTVAHLAGALGVTVWTILPHVANWRWQADREDSPWYPTMRLFRQEKPVGWDGVVEKIQKSLDDFTSKLEKLPEKP